MSYWPKIREGAIYAWYRIIDYDRKISPEKRAENDTARWTARRMREHADAKREKAKANRVAARPVKTKPVQPRESEVIVSPEVMRGPVTRMDPASHHPAPMLVYQPQPQALPQLQIGQCPQCRDWMKASTKSASAPSGCIILILGLVLAPFLIGIPIILVGLHYMLKTEGLWLCRRCGYQGYREQGTSILTILLLVILAVVIWYFVTVSRAT